MMMTQSTTMKVAKGVAAGIMIGGAIGAATVSMMKPKKSKFKRSAGKALDAVGTMMQNVSDWAF